MAEEILFESANNNDNQTMNESGEIEHLRGSAEEKEKDEEETLVSGMEYDGDFLQDTENTDIRDNQFVEGSGFLNIDGIEESAGNNVSIKLDMESEDVSVKVQSWEVDVEAEKEASELQNVCGLVNGMDTKTEQDTNSDVPTSELLENLEKSSEENVVGQETILLEECKEMVKELSATIKECSTSDATGLREIGNLQDHNLQQGLGEIPADSCKQKCDDNLPSKEFQSCGHDAAIGDPDSISLVHVQNLDASPQLNEGFQEEREGGDLQSNHNEEPSADKLPIEQKTNLSASTQVDDGLETSFGQEGDSREVDVVEEKDVTRRDLVGATSKTCGEESVPAVTEKQESSDSGTAGTIPGTNEHLNLDKEILSTAAATPVIGAKEHEAISVGPNELIDLPIENEINLKRRSSTSSSSTKKRGRRKSSHHSPAAEILNLPMTVPDKFSVGDLVWGKVRSHPWWPGQIFDPSDASETASHYIQRMNRKDLLLVAFFGDATFGWCEASHLVPFQPYFAEKVKQTNAKGFKNAVINALDELARRVELGLTCFCEVKEARRVLESKAMLNAGIREGTVVNDHKDTVDAVHTFDPFEFLSTIRHFAKSPYMVRDLEISIACAQASAFLTFKGLLVSGKISLETSEIQGVSIYTQDSAELGLSKQVHASSSGKHQRKPEEKTPRRTKKRKINDLIAECEPDGIGDDETLLEMAGRIKRRKVKELIAENVSPDEEEDLNDHDETLHDTAVTGSGDARAESKLIGKEARGGTAESKEGSLRRRVGALKTKKDQESETVASDILSNDMKALKTSKLGQCIRKVASELTATPSKSKTVRNANFQKNEGHYKSASKGWLSTIKQSPGSIQESSSTRELLSELLIVAKNPLYWAKKKNMPSRLINSFLQFRNAVFEKSSTNLDITKASILNFTNEPDEPTLPRISARLPGSSSISESKGIDCADRELSLRPTSYVRQAKLKRKAEFSLEGAKRKKRTTKSPSPPWSRKNLKNELEDNTGDRYAKQYTRRATIPQSSTTPLKNCSTDSYGSQGPAALFMKFPKGFALPSEMQLKAKFARYGSQEISETRVFRRSGCAQVVFKTSAAAEAAFNFASENNVFGSENVSFRLRYPSSGSRAASFQKKDHSKQERSIQQDHRQKNPSSRDKLREGDGHQEIILHPLESLARSTEKLGATRPNTSGEPQLLLIQQNLEMMTSMLSRSECTSTSATATSDNIPPDSKRDIMDEMMSLLQKVSALVSSPP